MPSVRTPSRRRVQIDLPAESFERLRTMKDKSGAKNLADVVRDALRLYEWYLDDVVAAKQKIRLLAQDGSVTEIKLIFSPP